MIFISGPRSIESPKPITANAAKRYCKGAETAEAEPGYYHIFRMNHISDKSVYKLSDRIKNKADRGQKTGVLLCKKRFRYHLRRGNAQNISCNIACYICDDAERAYFPCALKLFNHKFNLSRLPICRFPRKAFLIPPKVRHPLYM